jgi:septum formation protein
MTSGSRLPKIILASRSPRRRQLLVEAGYMVEVTYPADAAESAGPTGETPEQMVARLACQKAADVASSVASGLIVGCDTVVECEGLVLGKPSDVDDARRMLRGLRGRQHRVLSGLCVWKKPNEGARVRVAETVLRMDPLSDSQIEEYLASGAWEGKAGAFGYQDRLGWVHVLAGSETNVVGLPMELLTEMLAEVAGTSREC